MASPSFDSYNHELRSFLHNKDETCCGVSVWGLRGWLGVLKQTNARHTYCSSEDRQEMQGRFPAPDTGLGTQYPISLSHPQTHLADQRQRGESRCVPILKILPIACVGVIPEPQCCRILCLLLSLPDPLLCLLVTALEFPFTLTSFFYLILSPLSCCESTSFVFCVCLCESLSSRGVDWKQGCGLVLTQPLVH